MFVEQPLGKSPYSLDEYHNIVSEVAQCALANGYVVAIKPHPKTYTNVRYAEVTNQVVGVVRLSKDISLNQAIRHCHFAVGFTSSALLEVRRAGKATLSVDLLGWANMAGIVDSIADQNVASFSELKCAVDKMCRTQSNMARFFEAVRRRVVWVRQLVSL